MQPDGTVVAAATGVSYVTFTDPLPNANYSVTTGAYNSNSSPVTLSDVTVNGFTVRTFTAAQVLTNLSYNFAVFATDGNAGGFWVKTGDELSPLSDTADVKVGGNVSAGDITSGDGNLIGKDGFVSIRKDGASYDSFNIYNGGTSASERKVKISNDGSATFDARVTAGDFLTTAAGAFRTYSDTDGVRFGVFDNSGSVTKASISNDGSAEFTGNVTAPNVTFAAPGEASIDVKDRITDLIDALTALKTSAAASTDHAELKAAIATALANF